MLTATAYWELQEKRQLRTYEEFCPPVVECKGNDEKASDYVKVTVEDPKLCPRYCARVVKNVKIGPISEMDAEMSGSNGIRPINNLVDITNYVMEEFGQPMHAMIWTGLQEKKSLYVVQRMMRNL